MIMDEKSLQDIKRKQRSRNIALAIAIFALVGLFYVMSIVRMSSGGGS